MTLNTTLMLTLFIVMLENVSEFHVERATKRQSAMALACLPRISLTAGKPIFWNLFGQNGDKDDEAPQQPNSTDADDRSQWTTVDWITKHKYALELHNITTEDGYQLQLQRLPQPGHRPILLVHGLCTSSLSWVLMGPDKSLAFLLFNKQYDVWLANLRGSTYARNHTIFNVASADFWSFSFHEIGYYDLPAIVDYVRDNSSFHQLVLVGHSEAFNAFLVMCATQPVYNERILFMQALAPTVELKDSIEMSFAEVRGIMKLIKRKTQANSFELFPPGYLRQKCVRGSTDERRECSRYMSLIAGNAQHSKSMHSIIYGQLLQGGSLKQATHLQQLYLSGDFVSYDYGVEGNRAFYNAVIPNSYDLQQVSVPVILHFGQSDALATPEGVHRIYSRLLSRNYVLGVYRVAAERFNHLDFLCATDVKTLINDKIIDIIEKYIAGQLQYVIE